MQFTKQFNQISKADATIAGGKGASLGEMTQAGLAVPAGFVVLADAFERFIEETDLNVEIDAELHKVKHEEMHTVEHASETIQALILETPMPKDLGKDILAEFKKLGAEFVAVRSSATAEDSSSAAWAGQLDTFLNTTEGTLLDNVRRCWASLFTPRAIFYRFEQQLHKHKISVAVVIQKMVQSEIAGVAFSVHPVTQDRNQLIIEAGWGLGEAVVSGSITPDSYVVEKKDWSILDVNVAEQEKMLVRKGGPSTDSTSSLQAGSGQAGKEANEWVSVSAEKKDAQKLSGKEIIELAKLVVRIEEHYGFPCDIEWAREGNDFYITQSRPITTLT